MGKNNFKDRKKVPIEELTKITIEKLRQRGVELQDIADIIYELQSPYIPNLSMAFCMYHLNKVIKKREVVNAVLTGIELDILAEKDLISEPILSIIKSDDNLYGIDEILPLSIVNLYGSIGLTNFGYLDKEKIGIIQKLDTEKNDVVNTFLDDIVAALVAASASRMAHSSRRPDLDSYE